MSFHIRPAQAQDIIHIMHIYNREIENGLATWNNIPKSLEEYQQKLEETNYNFYPFVLAVNNTYKEINTIYSEKLDIPPSQFLLLETYLEDHYRNTLFVLFFYMHLLFLL